MIDLNETEYFHCDGCGETFVKGWSDLEAEAEFQANFPDNSEDDEKAVLCDACYAQTMAQRFWLWLADEEEDCGHA